MELYQIKTFVTVAQEGSITRASKRLHLSQPAISAHIKSLERSLGVTLFERVSRGMQLTPDGKHLLEKAKATLRAHQSFLEDAMLLKGELTGSLRLGVGANSSSTTLEHLLAALSAHHADVEISLLEGNSDEVTNGIKSGILDGGFYNEQSTTPQEKLTTMQVDHFGLCLVAPPGKITTSPLDWQSLGEWSWICPDEKTCCGRTVHELLSHHGLTPKQIIRVDRESVTRTLVSAGVGIGVLHSYTASQALAQGEVDVLYRAEQSMRTMFGYLTRRKDEPLLQTVVSLLRAPGGS